MSSTAYRLAVKQLSTDYRNAVRAGYSNLARSILEQQRDLLRRRHELTRQR